MRVLKQLEKRGILFQYKTINIKFIYMIWAILLFLVLIWFSIDLKDTWRNAQGYEYEWVAQSLGNGYGYSFEAQHRWLFPELNSSPDNRYYPTAWVEPGYTLIMAGIFRLFGQEGRLVLVILQTILWYITALIIVYLGTRVFNLWTGILASLLLVFMPAVHVVAQQSLGNVMMAGLMVCVSALLIFWCLEKVSPVRGIVLGLGLGVASLVHSVIFVFIPTSIFFILLMREVALIRRWKTVFVLIITVFFVLSPWFLRNLFVFHHFVPLRDGFGFNSYIGNPALVETYRPEFRACSFPAEKEVKVKGPWEAVQVSKQIEVQRAFYQRAYQCLKGRMGENYDLLNEAERDQEYLNGTIDFILERPILWFEVTIYKSLLFFGGSSGTSVISILAVVGVLLGIKNHKAIILFTLILAYSVSYSLALPFYYRYRYPIEPLILLLASSTITYVFVFAFRWFQRKRSILQ